VDSRDSVAWNAYRDAERLADLSLATELDHHLDHEPDHRRRAAAYFAIGKIGKNTGNEECARILIAYALREKNKYALAALLEGLVDLRKPKSLDLAPVLALIEDKRWLVRHSAIRALAHANPEVAEGPLLERASRTTDTYDLTYVNAILRSVGTERSVPYLSHASHSRKEDVAASAVAALSKIAGPAQLSLYIEMLEAGWRAVKWGAMAAIADHGDKAAIPAVVNRIGRILTRRRTIVQLPQSELLRGLTFLYRFKGLDPRVDDLFDRILPRKAKYLIGNEPAEILALTHDQRDAQTT